MAETIPTGFEVVEEIPEGFEVVEQQRPKGGLFESIVEPIKAVGSGIARATAGGLLGLASAPLAFEEGPELGAKVSESIQAGAFQPETEAGQKGLETLGEAVQFIVDKFNFAASGIGGIIELVNKEGLDQAVKTIESIQERGAGVTFGERTLEETGDPFKATMARIAPEAALEATAVGAVGRGAIAAKDVATQAARGTLPAVRAGVERITTQSPAKQRIGRLLEEGSTDVETARFDITRPSTPTREARVGTSKTANEAIKQGFEEGVIASVRGSTSLGKAKMQRMVGIMERVKANREFGVRNRPSDVLGDSLLDRYRIVFAANRKAGSELSKVAKSLEGQKVDFSSAVNQFLADLRELGVKGIEEGQIPTPNFVGATIEFSPPAKRIIMQTISRMKNTPNPDALDVHNLKRIIDEQVTFGKNVAGLGGEAEFIMKTLRRNLDQVLDSTFPEYNRVNTTFSETIGVIDDLQAVAGKKIDLSGPNADAAIGTLLRRTLSNAQSRIPLIDVIDKLEAAANKLQPPSKQVARVGEGGVTKRIDLNDSLDAQILFVDELDKVFGPVARTSFQGQISQGIEQSARALSTKGGSFDAAARLAGAGVEKLRGIDDKGAFKAIRELLKER